MPGTAGYVGGTSTGSKLVIEEWDKTIDADVYELMEFGNAITEVSRLYNKAHLRKLASFGAPRTLTYATDDGTGLTYDTAADSEVTLSPLGRYLATAFSRSQLAQMDLDPNSEFRTSFNGAMAAGIDVLCLADVATLTTNTFGNSSYAIDRNGILTLRQKIRQAAKSIAPFGKAPLTLLYWPLQYNAWMSIPEITSANLRGGNDNPNISGVVYDALGMRATECGNLTSDALGVHNPMFHKSAFVISYNERTNIDTQVIELQRRLIAYVNFGHGVKWDGRAGDLRTAST